MTSFCENCNDVDKSRGKIPANCVNKGLPVLRIFSVVGGGEWGRVWGREGGGHVQTAHEFHNLNMDFVV